MVVFAVDLDIELALAVEEREIEGIGRFLVLRNRPQAGLVQNSGDGVLFGTTLYGGTNGDGTVYRVYHERERGWFVDGVYD